MLALHIDDLELVLERAVGRGVLNRGAAKAAVDDMRRANAALDEAHEATRDRTEDWDREVRRAVGEYNNALKEVHRLLERATL
jgi:hypothetical protein